MEKGEDKDITSIIREYMDVQEKQFAKLIEHADYMLKSADQRLERASVITLNETTTAKEMAKTTAVTMKILQSLEENYREHIKEANKAKDQIYDAYVKLLHKYEEDEKMWREKNEALQQEFIDIVKGVVNKPTTNITNTTGIE